MRLTDLFQAELRLESPWKVKEVHVSQEKREIDVWLTHRSGVCFACPECGAQLPVYDHVAARSWRHLDCGSFQTYVHARLPRVNCLLHRVRQAAVSWALPHAHFTVPFERRAIDVLLETDVLGATRLLSISWDEAWGLMERAVARGQRAQERQPIRRLGIDEKAIAKGHVYFTLVNDLDRGTVAFVSYDRKQESLEEYYRTLSAEELAAIEAVAMDMWDPYIAATKAYVADAASKIVFDRYHVMTQMLKAVDAVRKREHRALRAAGDDSLLGSKYLWLYSEENLPEYHEERFDQLQRLHLKTGRAWAIKESLRDLWRYQRRGWAERHWRRWYFWATHSRLPEVVKAARTLERHLPNILTYFAHRITNAASEGLNSKIQTVKKTLAASATASTSGLRFTSTAAD